MPDFSVTGIVTIDNTSALASADDVMTAADKATQKMVMLRRKALSTISLVNGMINQTYGVLKQLVERAGGIIDPMFDMMFTVMSTIVSTALAGAILWMSTLHPALVATGIILMVLSLELNIKSQMELAESKGLIKTMMEMMRRTARPPETASPFGVGF